jgi:hypothetical protein
MMKIQCIEAPVVTTIARAPEVINCSSFGVEPYGIAAVALALEATWIEYVVPIWSFAKGIQWQVSLAFGAGFKTVLSDKLNFLVIYNTKRYAFQAVVAVSEITFLAIDNLPGLKLFLAVATDLLASVQAAFGNTEWSALQAVLTWANPSGLPVLNHTPRDVATTRLTHSCHLLNLLISQIITIGFGSSNSNLNGEAVAIGIPPMPRDNVRKLLSQLPLIR